MPELPDVETMRRYFDATALHQRIDAVDVNSEPILEDVTARRLEKELEGDEFEGTKRHGKYLFADLSHHSWLVLHFGMTGGLKYFKDMDMEPEYDRLLISFVNDYHLAYEAQRKLGLVSLTESIDAWVAKKKLGPDVMRSDFDLAAFKDALVNRRGMIKPALMNQQIMAGIGNVYSDEILYQQGIHPRTKVSDMDEETLDELFQTMNDVLSTAIDHQAKPDQLPEDYIIPHRHKDGHCPRCGASVERVRVSGRTAYYCPNRQEEPT